MKLLTKGEKMTVEKAYAEEKAAQKPLIDIFNDTEYVDEQQAIAVLKNWIEKHNTTTDLYLKAKANK